MRAAPLMLLLLGACAATPDAPAEPERADQKWLDIPTRLKARRARIVLSSHWRDQCDLEAITVDRGDGSEWRAQGGVKLRLRGLEADLADTLTITFLDDHEHFVLYATDVDVIERRAEFVHRHRDLQSLTIADDKLSLFSR